MEELYPGIAGSAITYLAGDISAGQTTIAVADDSALPDAPNLATIGYGEHIETVRYGAKSNGVLQQVTRGIEGAPRAWQSGTEVARFYTAHEHNQIIEICKKAVWFDMFEEWANNGGAIKVFKNLFANGSKIHVDEIAVSPDLLLGGSVIVESGNNANGSYIKFGDGTLMCSGRVRASWTTTSRQSFPYPYPPVALYGGSILPDSTIVGGDDFSTKRDAFNEAAIGLSSMTWDFRLASVPGNFNDFYLHCFLIGCWK